MKVTALRASLEEPSVRTSPHEPIGTRSRTAVLASVAILTVAGMAAGLGIVLAAQATPTHTVGPDADDDHATISQAVAAAAPGDRIVVAPGIYPESVTVDKAGLTIEGRVEFDEDGDPVIPVVDAAGQAFGIRVTTPDVTLATLQIRAGSTGVLVDDGGDGASLVNLTIKQSQQNTAEIRFADGVNVDDVRTAGAAVNGLRVGAASGLTVTDSEFSGGLRGAHLFEADNATLTDVTADQNAEHGLVIEESDDVTLVRPRLTGNAIGIWILRSQGTAIESPEAESTSEHALLVQESVGTTITDPRIERGVTNGILLKDSQQATLRGGTVQTSHRGVHILRTDDAAIADAVVRSNKEHGIVVEASDAIGLDAVAISGAIRGLWLLDSSRVTLEDATIDGALEVLMLVTRTPDVTVTGTVFGDSQRWGIHLVSSTGIEVTGGSVGDTQCDVLFEGHSDATFTGVSYEDTNTPPRMTTDAAPGACDPDGDGFHSVFANLSVPATCTGQPWRFVLSDAGAQIPSHVHVVWSNARAQTVPLAAMIDGDAHYETDANPEAVVVQASVFVDKDWTGALAGPCEPAA